MNYYLLFGVVCGAIISTTAVIYIVLKLISGIQLLRKKADLGYQAHQFLLQQQQQARIPAPPPGKVVPFKPPEKEA